MRHLFINCVIIFVLLPSIAVSEEIDIFDDFRRNSSMARGLRLIMTNTRVVDGMHVLDEEASKKLVEIYPLLASARLANPHQDEIFLFLRMQATAMLKQELERMFSKNRGNDDS